MRLTRPFERADLTAGAPRAMLHRAVQSEVERSRPGVTVNDRIDEIAQAVAVTDAADLPALVALRDHLANLAGSIDAPELAPIADVARAASDLVGEIILREDDDVDDAMDLLHQGIDHLSALLRDAPAPTTTVAHDPPVDDAMDSTLDRALLDDWIAHGQERLADIETAVLAMERSDVAPDVEAGIRRHVHTLKGEAGVFGLSAVERVCHEAESAIARATDGMFPADAILAVVDWLDAYLVQLTHDPSAAAPPHDDLLTRLATETPPAAHDAAPAPTDAAPRSDDDDDDAPIAMPDDSDADAMIADFTAEAREHIESAETAVLRLEHDPSNAELTNTVFRAFHTIKGVAGFMNLEPIVTLAHDAETFLDRIRHDHRRVDRAALDLILETCDLLGRLVAALEGDPLPTRGAHRRLRDRLRGAASARLEGATSSPPVEGADPVPTSPSAPRRHHRADRFVKVSTARTDALMTMMGELVIAHQMLAESPAIGDLEDDDVRRRISSIGKLIRDLQDTATALRMVAVKGTFQKMARLVRDIAARSGKRINLIMDGEDTELDRNVVDEIGDPLVHLVRNACDHGLEAPEERRASGKPDAGTLHLRASHRAGSIIIEIEDDGRGLDRDRILARAIDLELLPPDAPLDEISDARAHDFIFHPGFSTADAITSLSGRGVGMDVVRRNIEALRGRVEIRSTLDKGSTFVLRLPLTMATVDGMVVRAGDHRYVLPLSIIQRCIRAAPDDLQRGDEGDTHTVLNGERLPVHRLDHLLDIDDGPHSLDTATLIVVATDGGPRCLRVDDVDGHQQVVIKPLGRGVPDAPGIAGGAILGDGRVALILDVDALLPAATSAEAA